MDLSGGCLLPMPTAMLTTDNRSWLRRGFRKQGADPQLLDAQSIGSNWPYNLSTWYSVVIYFVLRW